ncbi:SOS response-associated peptidase family protein [Collibacillus ludicampi]|uniref:SOS response-associated peptidase family protein n=1 Tax=Collibacillus ludicampi TaxID=2771369 RepID=UPI002494147A|nr:SOS response-associated peptidase family protein [Collibacillus ludicampi]
MSQLFSGCPIRYRATSDDSKVHTYTIIATLPNELVSEIHDRMPVIFGRKIR